MGSNSTPIRRLPCGDYTTRCRPRHTGRAKQRQERLARISTHVGEITWLGAKGLGVAEIECLAAVTVAYFINVGERTSGVIRYTFGQRGEDGAWVGRVHGPLAVLVPQV